MKKKSKGEKSSAREHTHGVNFKACFISIPQLSTMHFDNSCPRNGNGQFPNKAGLSQQLVTSVWMRRNYCRCSPIFCYSKRPAKCSILFNSLSFLNNCQSEDALDVLEMKGDHHWCLGVLG